MIALVVASFVVSCLACGIAIVATCWAVDAEQRLQRYVHDEVKKEVKRRFRADVLKG